MSALIFRPGPAWAERQYPVPCGQPLMLWLPRAALLVAACGPVELAGSCHALAWLGAQAPRLRVTIEEGGHYVLQQSGHVFLSSASGRTASLIVQIPAGLPGRLLARLRRRLASGTPGRRVRWDA